MYAGIGTGPNFILPCLAGVGCGPKGLTLWQSGILAGKLIGISWLVVEGVRGFVEGVTGLQ